MLQSGTHAPFLKSGFTGLPFSLCGFPATDAFGVLCLRAIPQFGKEKRRCYSQQGSCRFGESQTSPGSSVISAMIKQRNRVHGPLCPQPGKRLAHSSCSINGGELALFPSPLALELTKSRGVRWNLRVHLSLSMYTQAHQGVFPPT